MNGNHKLIRLKRAFSPATIVFARRLWLPVLISSVIFCLITVSFASSDNDESKFTSNTRSNEVKVEVDNFGKVTDFYYRGAQPKGDEYDQLAAIGIKTIVDLRNDPKDYARELAERAGMKYINLPMSDKEYPAPKTPSEFLVIANNKENWPIYVHCAGGRHRTGAMTAVFRMTMQGWDVNRAYDEMKDYDFYTRWGHKAMKKFVFDYYRDMNNKVESIAQSNK
jgi:protein tyrosine/serine phosphatase